MKDFLLDENDDLDTTSGDLEIGESYDQEIAILLRLNQGELKSDPILGPNLVRMMNGKLDRDEIQKVMKKNLGRDGKDYDQIKDYLTIKGND